MKSLLRALLCGAGLLALQFSASVHAKPYFQDKQITLVVGFSPGGGTDLFGRVFSDALGKHIEGKPSVIVQNMPGAGSVIASNYFASRAPKDGTVLMVGTGQLLMRVLLGLDGSTARIEQLVPLVASPMGRIAYAAKGAAVNTPQDLLKPKERVILGVPEAISTIDAVLGLRVLDVKYRAIVGYKGKSDVRLALERGEVNVDAQTTPIYQTSVQPLVEQGKVVPLFAQGLLEGDKLVRDPSAPDIPTVAELYETLHGKPPSGVSWEAYLSVVRAIGNGGKILMAHRDIPQEAQEALERGLASLLKDEDFLKNASNVLEGYQLQTGQPLRDSVSAIAAIPPEQVQWLKEFLTKEFQMSFK